MCKIVCSLLTTKVKSLYLVLCNFSKQDVKRCHLSHIAFTTFWRTNPQNKGVCVMQIFFTDMYGNYSISASCLLLANKVTSIAIAEYCRITSGFQEDQFLYKRQLSIQQRSQQLVAVKQLTKKLSQLIQAVLRKFSN